ncbi:MAG: histidinol dehydrogenase [Deltaproteobacteria bacterium]|nr:histidinol dehydrogenase [Deltaproteobacteria bacterium]
MDIQPKMIEDLTPPQRESLMRRSMEDISSVYEYVRNLVEDVRNGRDEVLLEISREFKEDVAVSDLEVSQQEIDRAYREVPPEVVDGLRIAARNITRFHRAQREREMWSIEVEEGILAGRLTRAMDRVGCYIPGGRAAYPSTVLMTVLPARVAGVKEVIATTPPGEGMVANPATLVAADIAGCDRVFKIGGPWGIAALAFGTPSVPRVDKIVGPGNKYVTAAKMIVYGEVDIDSPAGPSEALILADATADPGLVAVDFLSQAEHDPDSAALLITTSREIAEEVCRIINRDFPSLPRKDILQSSLAKHSHVLVAPDMETALEFTNEYAPEHLQILTEDPFLVLNRIRHAGSIFLGPYAPIPAGDYASGTNHVLPTGQGARMFSGLSVDDFVKKPTFQYLSRKGLSSVREAVVNLARAEGLPLHAEAVEKRFR